MKQYTSKHMKEVMEVRGYSPRTIESYIANVKNLASYFNKLSTFTSIRYFLYMKNNLRGHHLTMQSAPSGFF